jgi:site-specific recombinase XerD
VLDRGLKPGSTDPAEGLTRGELAPILRGALKDQSYRRSPLGTMVARYIRWFRNEYGATEASVRDYEAILAKMSILLADKEPHEVQTEDLREVIDIWAGKSARTRQKVTSVIRAFWQWADEQMLIAVNPAARIRRPKAEKKIAKVLPLDARTKLLTAAHEPRDRLGLYCLLGLGLRRAELAAIQVRDFDLARQTLRVFGKGQKQRLMPLRGPILAELGLFMAADLPHVGRPPQPDDYLMYPVKTLAAGKAVDGITLLRKYVGEPKKKPSDQSVHRWWYRKAQDAGLVGPGVTSGLNMHQARHMFAMEMRRAAGIESASQALGHADLNTTLGIYGHQDQSDLESAMDLYIRFLEDED